MQAIILAAGMGRRLGELTKNNTKCMLEVNGRRLIDRFIDQLSKYNLHRIVIVVGYEGKKLVEYISNRYPNLNISFVNNPIYDKTNNIYSLALAKDLLCEDDTILMESDLIFDDGMLDLLVNNPERDLALVAKYENWMDGTMVKIDDQQRILQFIPKQVSVIPRLTNTIKLSIFISSVVSSQCGNMFHSSKPIAKSWVTMNTMNKCSAYSHY